MNGLSNALHTPIDKSSLHIGLKSRIKLTTKKICRYYLVSKTIINVLSNVLEWNGKSGEKKSGGIQSCTCL